MATWGQHSACLSPEPLLQGEGKLQPATFIWSEICFGEESDYTGKILRENSGCF